jgi:hypothetical protein
MKHVTAAMFVATALATTGPAMAEDININANTSTTVRVAPPDLCVGKGPSHERCEEYLADVGLQLMMYEINRNTSLAPGPAPEAPRCLPGQWLTIDGCQGAAPLPPIKHEQAARDVAYHETSLCPHGRLTRDGCQ